jgi:putative chitinase
MTDDAKFFDAVRKGLLGPTLSTDEVTGCSAILAAMSDAPIAWTAYALATAYKETAHTMQPIAEMGGDAYFFRRYDPKGLRPDMAARLGNTQPGDGARYKGRGFVQLTGRANYARAGAKLGIDLVGHPELALGDDVAAKIMRRGMQEGWFTGASFGGSLPGAGVARLDQYTGARRIINGTDCAAEIADYAMHFQAALLAGGNHA